METGQPSTPRDPHGPGVDCWRRRGDVLYCSGMNAFRRLIVISLLAVLALILVVFSIGAVSYITVLDPSFAESRLDASGVYEDFADKAVDVLSENLEGSEQAINQACTRFEISTS